MTQLTLLLWAVAQTAPPAAEPVAQAAAESAAQSVGQPAAEDPAWQLYQRGVAALGAGRSAEARGLFTQVLARHPGHPAALASAGLLGSLGPAVAPPPPASAPPPADPAPPTVAPAPPAPAASEPGQASSTNPPPPQTAYVDLPSHVKKSGAGRTLLIGVQTAHGMVVGAELCLIADCSNFRVIGPVVAAGTLGGLIGSIKYSEDGISSGRAASIDAGTAFGFAHGALVIYSFEMDDRTAVGSTLLAGQLIGTVAGAHLWDTLGKPSIDDMAFSAVAAAGALYVAGPHVFSETGRNAEVGALGRGLSALVITDGAAITAWILRKEAPMSWGRGGVILASAVAGAFGGLGVDALIEGDQPTPSNLALFMAVGAYTGAIMSAVTTRDFDRSWGEDAPRSTVATRDAGVVPVPVVFPTDGGGLGGVAFTW